MSRNAQPYRWAMGLWQHLAWSGLIDNCHAVPSSCIALCCCLSHLAGVIFACAFCRRIRLAASPARVRRARVGLRGRLPVERTTATAFRSKKPPARRISRTGRSRRSSSGRDRGGEAGDSMRDSRRPPGRGNRAPGGLFKQIPYRIGGSTENLTAFCTIPFDLIVCGRAAGHHRRGQARLMRSICG